MYGKLTGWGDTIIAVATPQGIGAIGIVRLSGSKAIEIVDKLFPSKNLLNQASHTLHVGFIEHNNKLLDEVVISLYKNPRSYTGEDVVEISCHGSPFIMQQVLEACIDKGARLAHAGEFTQRAFLNKKLDLAQAESVADLIASNTEASQQAALHHMRGGFSSELKRLREELIKFSALIELELDFSQEDVAFADRHELNILISSIYISVTQLLQSFRLGNAIKNGIQVAIIGKPNVGKSTLLNALLKEERAIVSDIAGTTRDTIEEILNINGILFRLIDTAGIRQHTTDLIESIGIEKSREKIEQADIIIFIEDALTAKEKSADTLLQEITALNKPFIHIINKIDTIKAKTDINKLEKEFPDALLLTAKKEADVEVLKKELFRLAVSDNFSTESTIITNARHYNALQQVAQSIEQVQQGLENNIPGDLLASDIRQSLHHLGIITGEITHEDQLDYIFSKFCIGK